ncbi:DUF1295 domain-containing protein [Acidobacteriota bacterium]
MTKSFVLFQILIILWFAIAIAVFFALLHITAPYGRHQRLGWGPSIDKRIGWIIMESPAVLVFAAFFTAGEHRRGAAAFIFLVMWEAHYIHRAAVYPLRLGGKTRRNPVIIIALAFFFNVVNGGLNGWYLFHLSGGYAPEWMTDPRFLLGLGLFIAGFALNRLADGKLKKVKGAQPSGYGIPRGGLYEWVSCPNYLGEIIEWAGWALATWSLPGLAFAVWTTANLVPRARSHHNWYHRKFPDYPDKRRALIPGIW